MLEPLRWLSKHHRIFLPRRGLLLNMICWYNPFQRIVSNTKHQRRILWSKEQCICKFWEEWKTWSLSKFDSTWVSSSRTWYSLSWRSELWSNLPCRWILAYKVFSSQLDMGLPRFCLNLVQIFARSFYSWEALKDSY